MSDPADNDATGTQQVVLRRLQRMTDLKTSGPQHSVETTTTV